MLRVEVDRPQRIARECIETLGIDLDGLTVFTEAASGPYLHTPLVAAEAGARKVFAVTRDSAHARAEDVAAATRGAASEWGVAARVEVGFEKRRDWLGASDIVTNSGFVRPITAEVVAHLKPTAVIPLMWETWEFRAEELDLEACRERGVLVLGTCETKPPCDLRPYAAPLAFRVLLELGLEIARTKVLLLGAQPSLGAPMAAGLREAEAEVTWFGSDGTGARPYEELREHVDHMGSTYDAMLVAEHGDPRLLLGREGVLELDEVQQANPDLRVGVITGNLDAAGLAASNLRYFPANPRPFSYMSYQPSELGPRPVLELYAAGLKVGEAMARARLDGASPADAASAALERSPAMDFPGDLAWT